MLTEVWALAVICARGGTDLPLIVRTHSAVLSEHTQGAHHNPIHELGSHSRVP